MEPQSPRSTCHSKSQSGSPKRNRSQKSHSSRHLQTFLSPDVSRSRKIQVPQSAPGRTKAIKQPPRSTRKMLLSPMGHSSSDLMNIPEGADLDVSEVSDDDPFGASANWNDSYKRSDSARWNDSAVWNTSNDDESIQTAKSRVDEAFMHYTRVESAALQIQKNFRKKKLDREQLEDNTPQKDRNDTSDDDSDDSKKEDENEGRSYTLFMVALFALVPYIMMLAGCFTKCWGGDVDDVEGAPVESTVDGAANGAPGGAPAPGGNGGGGGGGGAAPPPGLEAMAGQAAGAASGSAGAGASAGAAAGAAAATSAAATATAAAGATAAGATTQVVAVVAVTSAVATAAGTSGILTPAAPAELILTKCGLADPQSRIGKFTLVFEGFPRMLDGRESGILEGLVLDAYNDLTIGSNFTETGSCLDPLKREMKEVNILKQDYVPLIEGLEGASFLEILFETKIFCDKCLPSSPLFKNEQDEEVKAEEQNPGEQQRGDEIQVNGTQAEDPTQNSARLLRGYPRRLEDIGEQIQDEFEEEFQNVLEQELMAFDISGADFFQRLIQKVIFETEELSLIGEFPSGFVSIAQAYVTPTPIENGVEVDTNENPSEGERGDSAGSGGSTGDGSSAQDAELFTRVKFQQQGDKAAFEFTIVNDETGEIVEETVLVDPTDPLSIPVPTTSLPTFAPTKEPTISPSTVPTITFSGQPTREPSKSPSSVPSTVPSEKPSNIPSTFPSNAPSALPSIMPSESPSSTPSATPSDIPSTNPSSQPSANPSMMPSESPSTNPSSIPSSMPSAIPSMIPSMIPSVVPSDTPSVNPSSQPSDKPSVNPSSQPSLNPSSTPSAQPSSNPSSQPSSNPSSLPSASPSKSPTTFPSVAPSKNPTSAPSKSPTKPPTPPPTPSPTVAPTVSGACVIASSECTTGHVGASCPSSSSGSIYTSSKPSSTMTISGGSLNFAWSGLPDAVAGSTVRIWANFEGDIDQASECAEVIGEGGRGFSGFCSYGNKGSTSTNYAFSSSATAAEFNGWKSSDGIVSMAIKLGIQVNPGVGINVGALQLSYCQV